jgi:hypothetical protein
VHSPLKWSVESSRPQPCQFTWMVSCVSQLEVHVHVHGQLSSRAWSAEGLFT